jgi:hypothetical protein
LSNWTIPVELYSGTVDGPVVSDGSTQMGTAVNSASVDYGVVRTSHFIVTAYSSVSGGVGFAQLQGSLDNSSWYPLTSKTDDSTTGVQTISSAAVAPARYVRSSCSVETTGNGQGHATISVTVVSE